MIQSRSFYPGEWYYYSGGEYISPRLIEITGIQFNEVSYRVLWNSTGYIPSYDLWFHAGIDFANELVRVPNFEEQLEDL